MAKQKEIFIAFFRASMLGFGGGPSTIPLVKKEVVETFRFMSDDEFTEILAIGNTLPGPIITKMAGYIGYRAGGMLGLINAILATVIPSAVLIILFLTALNEYKDLAFIQGMTRGVIPVIAVMMAVLAWDYIQKAQKSLGFKIAAIIFVIAFMVIIVFGLHPALVIVTLLALALLLPVKRGAK
ncbi:MAG: chromate transporter [Solibacillus sp.]